MVRRLLAVFTAFMVAGTLFAQNYKISLKLEDATNGEPVGFATVSATPEKGDTKYALTNHDGPPPWKNSARGSIPSRRK